MNISYFVCSTLRCETNTLSSTLDGFDDDIIAKTRVPEAVESSCSELSSSSEHQRSSSAALSDESSLSIDASLYSQRQRFAASRRSLKSGHTSPSSLALQRKPPVPHLSLDNKELDADISSASNSIRTNSVSNEQNGNMAIACPSRTVQGPTPSGLLVDIHGEERKKTRSSTNAEDPTTSFNPFCVDPPPLRAEAWSEPSAEEYDVRSKNYLKTGVKKPSEKSAFRLITVDLINTETPIYTGMCAHPGERVQKALDRERETGVKELPEFIFAVNLCIPAETIYHAVFYYGVDKSTMDEIKNGQTAFGRIMNRFIFGDSDEYRNQTFKLIPRVVEGNYLVRKGVGTKPAILGKKIKQCYVRGGGSGNDDHRFFEIIVDIASDPVAKRITKLCLGYIKTIAVEMMFALEGHDESTLPERIFGGAAVKHLDFKMMDGKRTVR